LAFAYGHALATRSILAAGLVIDGIPYHEIMPIGPGERYHRSRFDKTGKLVKHFRLSTKKQAR
jgi:hypothetical protein